MNINKCALVIFAFALLQMVLGLFMPLYTDEILWHFHFGRAFVEGDFIPNFLPACFSSAEIPIPWSWFPARSLDRVVASVTTTPMLIRWVGFFWFLLALGMGWSVLKKMEVKERGLQALFLGVIFFLGVTPLLMMASRPEQKIVLGVLIFVFYCLNPFRGKNFAFVNFFLIAVGMTWFLPQHPKTVFFVPLILLCLWYVPTQKYLKVLLMGLLVFHVWGNVSYSKTRTACPEHPRFESKYAKGGYELKNAEKNLFSTLWRSSLRHADLVDMASFNSNLGNTWLKDMTVDNLTQWQLLPNILITILFYGLFLLAMIEVLRVFQKKRNFSAPVGIGLVLNFCLLIVCAVSSFKPYYDSTLFFPLGILGNLLICGRSVLLQNKVVQASLMVVLISSQISYLIEFVPITKNEWYQPAEVEKYMFLTPLQPPQARNENIEKIASMCGIDLATQGTVFVDESTYLQQSVKKPRMAFFLNTGFIPPNKSIFSVLSSWKSQGLIARCSTFDPEISKIFVNEGVLCCLPPVDQIQQSTENELLFLNGKDLLKRIRPHLNRKDAEEDSEGTTDSAGPEL